MEPGASLVAPMVNINVSSLNMSSSSLSVDSVLEIVAADVTFTGSTRLTGQRVKIFSCSNIFVGSDTVISTTGKGYGSRAGPGYDSETYCAYHPSWYGNLSYPISLGSGGYDGLVAFGGGAAQLEASGLITLDGDIYCDGSYTSAGGSALLISHSLAGSGVIRADGQGSMASCSRRRVTFNGEGGIIAVHAVEWGESRLTTTAAPGHFIALVQHTADDLHYLSLQCSGSSTPTSTLMLTSTWMSSSSSSSTSTSSTSTLTSQLPSSSKTESSTSITTTPIQQFPQFTFTGSLLRKPSDPRRTTQSP